MNPNEDAERRIRELEEALRRKEIEAAIYKDSTFRFLDQMVPYVSPTDDELRQLMSDTSGTPIREIIAEYERNEQ